MKFNMYAFPLRRLVTKDNMNEKLFFKVENAGVDSKKFKVTVKIGAVETVLEMPAMAGPSLILCESVDGGVGVTTTAHGVLESLIMIDSGLVKPGPQVEQIRKNIRSILDLPVIQLVQTTKLYKNISSSSVASTDFNVLEGLIKEGTYSTVDLSANLATWVPSGVTASNDLSEGQAAAIEAAKKTIVITDKTESRCSSAAFVNCAGNSLFYYKVLLKIATFGIVPDTINVDSILALVDSSIAMYKLNPKLSKELGFGEPTPIQDYAIPDSIQDLIAATYSIDLDPVALAVFDLVPDYYFAGSNQIRIENKLAFMLSGDITTDAEGTILVGGKKTNIKGMFKPSVSIVSKADAQKIFSLLIAILSYHKSTKWSSETSEIINYADNPRFAALLSKKLSLE